MSNIHPTSIILDGCEIDQNVSIGAYSIIGPNVKIGDNSHIKSFSHLEGTKIEKNVTVGPYARLREGTVLKKNTNRFLARQIQTVF